MHSIRLRLFVVALVATAGSFVDAQQPHILQPEEYGRWEQLSAQRTPLSPDGSWLVYGINRSSRQNELRLQATAGGDAIVIAMGEQPAFSDDSKWAALLIGLTEDEEAKLRKEKKPLRKKLALVDLTTRSVAKIDGVESFSFSPSGSHLAMRRYADREPDREADSTGGGESVAPGTPLVLRALVTGEDTTFGSVSEMAWQDKGSLLAFAITVEGGVGNGLHLYDTATGVLRALDSSSRTYSGLTWRKDSASFAALRSADGTGREGFTHTLLAWTDVVTGTKQTLDPNQALASDLRVVRFRRPQWSEDGKWVFVGVALACKTIGR